MWSISCSPYHVVKIIWSISCGPYHMVHIKTFLKFLKTSRLWRMSQNLWFLVGKIRNLYFMQSKDCWWTRFPICFLVIATFYNCECNWWRCNYLCSNYFKFYFDFSWRSRKLSFFLSQNFDSFLSAKEMFNVLSFRKSVWSISKMIDENGSKWSRKMD